MNGCYENQVGLLFLSNGHTGCCFEFHANFFTPAFFAAAAVLWRCWLHCLGRAGRQVASRQAIADDLRYE